MHPIIKTLIMASSSILIASCATWNGSSMMPASYSPYSGMNTTNPSQLYPESYENTSYSSYSTMQDMPITEVQSKTMIQNNTPTQTPTPAKDMDSFWISQQDPNGYTLELANSSHALDVAKTLSQAPKKARMAEIKYEHQHKAYYKGLYGSYQSAEAAAKALHELPEDLQHQASIVTWKTVQD